MSAGSNAVDWRILLAITFAKGLPSALRGVAGSSEFLYNLQFLYLIYSNFAHHFLKHYQTLPEIMRMCLTLSNLN